MYCIDVHCINFSNRKFTVICHPCSNFLHQKKDFLTNCHCQNTIHGKNLLIKFRKHINLQKNLYEKNCPILKLHTTQKLMLKCPIQINFFRSAHYDVTDTFVTLNLTQSSLTHMVFLESRMKTHSTHSLSALSPEVTLLHEEIKDL